MNFTFFVFLVRSALSLGRECKLVLQNIFVMENSSVTANFDTESTYLATRPDPVAWLNIDIVPLFLEAWKSPELPFGEASGTCRMPRSPC